jgi:hypothetical protein
MYHRAISVSVVLAASLLAGACGDASTDDAAATVPGVPTTVPDIAPDAEAWPTSPPPVVFEPAGGPVTRAPFTVCWSEPVPDDPNEEYESYCADGMPEDDPPVVEPIDGRVWFTFPVADWEFSASYLDAGGAVEVEQIDATVWELVVPDDAPGGRVMVSGFGPQGDVHVAVALPGPVSDESASECVEARDALRQGLPAYDYEPAVDLTALVDRVDAVAIGTIDEVRAEDDRIEFVLMDARTWGGDRSVEVVETDGRLEEGVDALSGAPAIAFVHDLDDGGFGVDVQGLHVVCNGALVNVIETLPSDPRIADPAEIDDLLEVVVERKAPLDPSTDVYGVGMAPPDAIDVGEVVPVQVWWRCAAGVSVRVGDDLYLPDGEIDGLVPRPAREWQRDDFPAEWEVIIYNETPVDGDDWVILDAVVTRIDADTLEVGHVDGEVIGAFRRDTTPPDERTICG